jgi:hypothetical protein
MRTLHRRLRRLEERFGPSVETEYSRELLRRIDAGLRRVAAARGETFVPLRPSSAVAGLTPEEANARA